MFIFNIFFVDSNRIGPYILLVDPFLYKIELLLNNFKGDLHAK